MLNYYEELGIDRSLTVEELNKEITRLETIWIKREISNPEKARKILGMLDDAKKFFKSESSRKTYDCQLELSDSSGQKDVFDDVNKWSAKAREYSTQGMNDLAKEAIDRALMSNSGKVEDPDLYSLASEIYCNNGLFSDAISYINKSIVLVPEVSRYYLMKSLIYDKEIKHESNGINIIQLRENCRHMLNMAINKARIEDDKETEAKALGVLAFSLWFNSKSQLDKDEAKRLALLTVELGGDQWGNANVVLSEEKLESTYKKAKAMMSHKKYQEALDLLKQQVDYKDSAQLLDVCRKECKKQLEKLKERESKRVVFEELIGSIDNINDEKKYREIAQKLSDYLEFEKAKDLQNYCLEKAEEFRKDRIYEKAVLNLKETSSLREMNQSLNMLHSISGWKDSETLLQKYELIFKEKEAKQNDKNKKTIRIFFVGLSAFLILSVAIYIFSSFREKKESLSTEYNNRVIYAELSYEKMTKSIKEGQDRINSKNGSTEKLYALQDAVDKAKELPVFSAPEKATNISELEKQNAEISNLEWQYNKAKLKIDNALQDVINDNIKRNNY